MQRALKNHFANGLETKNISLLGQRDVLEEPQLEFPFATDILAQHGRQKH